MVGGWRRRGVLGEYVVIVSVTVIGYVERVAKQRDDLVRDMKVMNTYKEQMKTVMMGVEAEMERRIESSTAALLDENTELRHLCEELRGSVRRLESSHQDCLSRMSSMTTEHTEHVSQLESSYREIVCGLERENGRLRSSSDTLNVEIARTACDDAARENPRVVE